MSSPTVYEIIQRARRLLSARIGINRNDELTYIKIINRLNDLENASNTDEEKLTTLIQFLNIISNSSADENQHLRITAKTLLENIDNAENQATETLIKTEPVARKSILKTTPASDRTSEKQAQFKEKVDVRVKPYLLSEEERRHKNPRYAADVAELRVEDPDVPVMSPITPESFKSSGDKTPEELVGTEFDPHVRFADKTVVLPERFTLSYNEEQLQELKALGLVDDTMRLEDMNDQSQILKINENLFSAAEEYLEGFHDVDAVNLTIVGNNQLEAEMYRDESNQPYKVQLTTEELIHHYKEMRQLKTNCNLTFGATFSNIKEFYNDIIGKAEAKTSLFSFQSFKNLSTAYLTNKSKESEAQLNDIALMLDVLKHDEKTTPIIKAEMAVAYLTKLQSSLKTQNDNYSKGVDAVCDRLKRMLTEKNNVLENLQNPEHRSTRASQMEIILKELKAPSEPTSSKKYDF